MPTSVVMPKAGVDYPASFPQMQRWFPDERACAEYLAGLRWPEGFVCPVCGSAGAWRTGTGAWKCQSCGRKTSVTAGTIFHRSQLPLTTWFSAVWFVTAQKNGVSALGLQRALGLGSYQTAWAWMHKLRRAMVRPDRDRLGGPGVAVEVDQTFIGGRAPITASRYGNKAEVAIAVERRHPRGLGRIRIGIIAQRKTDLVDFTIGALAPGSILYTDGEPAFAEAAQVGELVHEPISLVATGAVAHTVLPAVHRVASLLKRWLAGTLHHGYSFDQLAYYLDEYTFRFNRRDAHSRGLLFYRLLQQATATDPHPYRQLLTPNDHNI